MFIFLSSIILILTFGKLLHSQSHKEGLHIFSPYFYPGVYFSVFYFIPSCLGYLAGTEKFFRLHNYLYLIGAACYLIGVFIYNSTKNNHSYKQESARNLHYTTHSINLKFFILSGAALLVAYGIWTGITITLLNGGNIEGLRRTAEIGKGFLKTPGIIIISVSSLWLIANILNNDKRNKYILSLTLISFCILIIFITVGHKKAALLPLMLYFSLICKHIKINRRGILIMSVALFILVSSFNFWRANKENSKDTIDLFLSRSLVVFKVYEYNYKPIVQAVRIGSLPMQYGTEYYNSAVSLVPRFLYPEKPLSFDYFLKVFFNRTFEGGGLPPTAVGSLYLNFGFTGVVLGFFLIGYCYAYLFNKYIESTLEQSVIISYIMYHTMNPSQLIGSTIFLLLFFVFMNVTHRFLEKVTNKSLLCSNNSTL